MSDDVSKRIEEIRGRLAPALALGAWRQVTWNGEPDAEVTTSPPGVVEGDKHVCDCRSANYSDAGRDVEIAKFIAQAPEDIDWLLNQIDLMLGNTLDGDLVDEGDGIQFRETEASVAVRMRYMPKESHGRFRTRPKIEILNRCNGTELGVLHGRPATAMRKDLELSCRVFVDGELFLLAQLPRSKEEEKRTGVAQ